MQEGEEQGAQGKEQRAQGKGQRAQSTEQRAEGTEQRAEGRGHRKHWSKKQWTRRMSEYIKEGYLIVLTVLKVP
jgi:hypothetical protein